MYETVRPWTIAQFQLPGQPMELRFVLWNDKPVIIASALGCAGALALDIRGRPLWSVTTGDVVYEIATGKLDGRDVAVLGSGKTVWCVDAQGGILWTYRLPEIKERGLKGALLKFGKDLGQASARQSNLYGADDIYCLKLGRLGNREMVAVRAAHDPSPHYLSSEGKPLNLSGAHNLWFHGDFIEINKVWNFVTFTGERSDMQYNYCRVHFYVDPAQPPRSSVIPVPLIKLPPRREYVAVDASTGQAGILDKYSRAYPTWVYSLGGVPCFSPLAMVELICVRLDTGTVNWRAPIFGEDPFFGVKDLCSGLLGGYDVLYVGGYLGVVQVLGTNGYCFWHYRFDSKIMDVAYLRYQEKDLLAVALYGGQVYVVQLDTKRCPRCGRLTVFVPEYGRWYCQQCKIYP